MTDVLWYFEDFQADQVIEVGEIKVSEEEIVEFGRRYDPQPFHINRELAASSHGGVIASGCHTLSLMMRLIVDGLLKQTANLPSPGLDELRWLKPVRGGDTLSVRCVILSTRVSVSKPDRGVVMTSWEARNQHGELVATVKVACMVRLRSQAA